MKLRHVLKKLIICCLGVLALYSAAHAQGTFLKGHVLDSHGTPLPGVVVKIKGTTRGVATDAQGAFEISYKAPAALVVTAIGYITREINLTNSESIEIRLAEDNQQLDEVVVTALGVKREKRILTYSSQEIKGNELVQSKDP